MSKNTFLAGGINLENIKEALKLNPFAIDLSSGAETNGFKDREKILKLVETVSHI
jgi:phosphoribosylanthranilate isomerase